MRASARTRVTFVLAKVTKTIRSDAQPCGYPRVRGQTGETVNSLRSDIRSLASCLPCAARLCVSRSCRSSEQPGFGSWPVSEIARKVSEIIFLRDTYNCEGAPATVAIRTLRSPHLAAQGSQSLSRSCCRSPPCGRLFAERAQLLQMASLEEMLFLRRRHSAIDGADDHCLDLIDHATGRAGAGEDARAGEQHRGDAVFGGDIYA